MKNKQGPPVSLNQFIKRLKKKDPGRVFKEWEREGIFEILERWQKQGMDLVDICFVIGCLLYSRLQFLIKPDTDDMIKSLQRSSNSIGRAINKIGKAIKAIEPPFGQNELIEEVENILKEISSLKKKKELYELIARTVKNRHSSIVLYMKGNPKIPALDATRDMPIVLVHNLLANRVGISAYGRKKSVPFELQRDLLTLFRRSDPQHFHQGLTLSTLSQRVSSINKSYPELVTLSAENLLKFLSQMLAEARKFPNHQTT